MKARRAAKATLEYLILFAIGGGVYCLIELLWRRHTHWTMFLAGGLCFCLLGAINRRYEYGMSLIAQTVIGGLAITAVEFAFGLVLNVWLKLHIWDYSGLPHNLMGQVCLAYVYLWQWLSLVGIVLNDWTRHWLFGEQRPKYKIL